MGFIDKAKGVFGSSSGEEGLDDTAGEFAEEFEEDEFGGDEFEDGFEEEEPEMEWDNPYQFAGDMLEPDGFANMSDFIVKAMYYECSNSPLYRDRLKQGAQTIDMVSSSVQSIKSLQGGDGGSDYGEMAEKLEDMDRAVQAAESLSGKEDQIIQDGMNIAREAVQAIGNASNRRNAEVESAVTERDGKL